MKRARLKKLAVKIILFLVLINAGLSVLYYNLSVRFGKENTENKTYDAAVVFFHGTDKQGNLSGECKRRLDYTVTLYNEGKFRHIICTGGGGHESVVRGAVLMKEYLEKFYIPSNRIIAESGSYSTLTNWRESVKIIEKNGYKSCLLISSPLHILRIKHIAGDSGILTHTATYRSDESIPALWLGCNMEFAKWFALIFLPEKTTDWLRSVLL